MSKDIPLNIRPNKSSVDSWVKNPSELSSFPNSRLMKLSIELDADLHKRLKRHCFEHDVHIAKFVRSLIESATAKNSSNR